MWPRQRRLGYPRGENTAAVEVTGLRSPLVRASLDTGRQLPGVQYVTAHNSNLCTALIC